MSGTPQDAGTPVVTTPEKPTPTEGETQVTAEDKTPDAATEGENTDGTKTTDEGEQKPERKRGDGGFQRRINRLTADFRAAQAKADAAEAKARELESKLSKPTQSDEVPLPKLENFKSYEEFEAATHAAIAENSRRRTRAELENERKEEEEKASAKAQADRIKEARERFDKAAEAIADDYEGFDDFLDDLNGGHSPLRDLHAAALEQIFENDDPKIGAALGFHLHQHPAEAKRIAALRPAQQVAALARLEASLPKPNAKTVTKAPAPPNRVKPGGGPDGKDESKMSIPELRRHTGSRARVPD